MSENLTTGGGPLDDAAAYELAWRLAHSGLEPDDAIEAVAYALHVPRGVASGLVWAEMVRSQVVLPSVGGGDDRPPHWEPRPSE